MSRFTLYSSFLLLLRLAAAQSTETEGGAGFKPTTAIVMIVFVSVFFSLGCVSVFYMRKCLAQPLGIDDGRSGDTGNWLNARQTACGLDASVIETFPTFRYSTVKTLRIGEAALECPVCLNGFKDDDETLRLIPRCCHVFHTGCIDAWLRSHATCPLCRANLVPVPGESVSFEISGLARESGQNSPRTSNVNDRRRGLGSPDKRLIDAVAWSGNKSTPRKSMSTGWKLAELFSRSSSTGQPEENQDRFTLRLPQEIHDQLVNQGLKDQVALPQARSALRGYRAGSLGSERNYFYFERFDQDGRFDRRPFSITPPYWTGSIQSPDIHGG
ncbi:hypothetical protein Bca4012_055994 [Brassica carinata]|uniref:RING-type E3 ubiquitin transferase n=1 Tax=Brassica carinata TaxID=52824 RepID=A0A8X7W0C5_BRACI|nr:hypothetical protein Bca52824_014199 [Brassica carinata]